MEYWLGIFHEDNEQMKTLARAAEQMGFAGIALPDHVAMPAGYKAVHPSGRRHIEHDTRFPCPFITAANITAVTERLRVMTYIYVLPMREPFTVAKQVATLCAQSDYRFDFGIGAGWCEDEFRIMGPDFGTRGARMDEMLSIMRQFWETGECAFEGSHFSFPTVGQQPQPARRIPVWVGGKSRAALRRAARNDGWLGMNYGMEEIHALLARLGEERARYLDDGGTDHGSFRRFVIPEAMPSHDVYRQLEDWGVDGTVALCWGIDDPAYFPLERKLEGMEAFARTYLR
jgi:probable F420-dependent oxidoreductase